MPTVSDIVKYLVREKSDRIFQIKKKATVRKNDLVVGHIKPGHEDWEEYRRLKMEVSILLTCVRIIRLCNIHGPNLVSVIDLPNIPEHRPKEWRPSGVPCTWEHAALRKLRRIDKLIRKLPVSFIVTGWFKEVDAYLKAKEHLSG